MNAEPCPTDVSVVIPAYRAARTIRRAIESVLRGTLRPREIVVVDDGSPDPTATVARASDPCVRVLRQPNAGAAAARNRGLDAAQGAYLAFLDADDYWESTALAQRMHAFAAHLSAGAVASRWFEESPQGQRWPSYVEHEECFGTLRRAGSDCAFATGMCIWTSALVVRRAALGDLRFESGLEPAEDRDLWIRLAATCDVYLLDEPLATAVLEPGSLSRSNIDRDYQNMMRVVRKHAALLGAEGRRAQEAVVLRRWAARYLAAGVPAAALPRALERLRIQPLSPQAWWVACKAAVLSKTQGA